MLRTYAGGPAAMPEPGLHQSQTQSQTMVLAPQLRQGLEVLQATILELQGIIEQEIQANPVLEEVPKENERLEVEPGAMTSEPEATRDEQGPLDFSKEDFAALAKLDEDWTESERTASVRHGDLEEAETRHQFLLDSLTQSQSLQDHLMDQLGYLVLTPAERQLAELIIGSVNEKGYLGTTLQEISANTGVDERTLQRVLAKVRAFEPAGVAARDLKECLLIQLRRQGRGESLAAEIVAGHLPDLGARRHGLIAKALKVDLEDIAEAAEEIASLEPMPGREFEPAAPAFVTAEVAIERVDGELQVRGRDDNLPRLRISNLYRNLMMDEKTSPEVRRYILEKVKAGENLIKSIGQRQSTIQRIAGEILKVQREFMTEGVGKLRPLTMAEVAEKIGVHETTVSRAISNKFIETPQGLYEMKYFFTPGFKTADGQEVSNKSIKDVILQLVDGEDARKPLSDQTMVEELKSRGIDVARRTIAKYREELNIQPSHMRRERS